MEANDPAYMPLLSEQQKDYIYHAELVLGNQRIIMSDHVDIEFTVCYSNFLTIMFKATNISIYSVFRCDNRDAWSRNRFTINGSK